MRLNSIAFIIDNFFSISLFVVVFSIVLYFFGDRLTLDNNKKLAISNKSKNIHIFLGKILF